MSLVEQHIIKFIAENELIISGDKLLIALSGGADSVFALTFFNKYKSKYNIEISAIHVNHSMRGSESDADDEFCKSLCQKLNIEFYSEKVDVPTIAKKEKLSIEEAARNIRYELFNKYLKISNSNKIVTAHNLDDNTETVLLNLFRGTGLKGLSGIPVKRDNIVRPFLTVSKNEIVEYLNNKGITFVFDSTNAENDFKRNYLRNEIIPKVRDHINEGVDKNILRLSQLVKSSEQVIDKVVEEKFAKYVSFFKSKIKILKAIRNEDSFVRGEIIRKCIQKNFSADIDYENFQSIEKLFDQQVGNRTDLSKNIEAISERDFLIIREKINTIDEEFEYKLHFDSNIKIGTKYVGCEFVNINEAEFVDTTDIEYIDADNLPEPFVLRKWKTSDRFNPIGLNGTKKVSDFLTDCKVPNIERENQLVLLNQDKIIWVVGLRLDESVKITEKTKKVLKLWVK
ncbi:MAG: tRNA lysidine(34) synthetase TilS [Bacteroidota bacterium]